MARLVCERRVYKPEQCSHLPVICVLHWTVRTFTNALTLTNKTILRVAGKKKLRGSFWRFDLLSAARIRPSQTPLHATKLRTHLRILGRVTDGLADMV